MEVGKEGETMHFFVHNSAFSLWYIKFTGPAADEDVSGEKQALFLILIQCMILNDTIICYSLCLESAACGWRSCRAL